MLKDFNYLRVSITDRCNFRCKYCEVTPSEKLSNESILNFEEILRFVKIAVHMGVKTVRITGGEPLVRNSAVELFKMIKRETNVDDLTFTTNGLFLDKYASDLFDIGVTRFNVSLDSLDPVKFKELTGSDSLAKVIENIVLCKKIGFNPIKINVVALRGINDNEACDFVEFARAHGLSLRFIELMDICASSREFFESRFVALDSIKTQLIEKYKLVETSEMLPKGRGPAVYYSTADHKGHVGFISPVSRHFCENCNRLRLMANGLIKSCLLRTGEVNIMELIRNGAPENEIIKIIEEIFKNKERARGKFSACNRFSNMSEIGG